MIIFEQQITQFSILYLQKQQADRVADGVNILTALKIYCTVTPQNTLHISSNTPIPTNTKDGLMANIFLEKIFMMGYHLLIINLE